FPPTWISKRSSNGSSRGSSSAWRWPAWRVGCFATLPRRARCWSVTSARVCPPLPSQGIPQACQATANAVAEPETDLRAAQEDLRNATSPQERTRLVVQINRLQGEIQQKKQELSDCLAANAWQPEPLRVDLVTGVLASAALPGILRPVKMGADTY